MYWCGMHVPQQHLAVPRGRFCAWYARTTKQSCEAVCSNDDKRLLCPVRALQWYLNRTQSPSRPRYLFLSVRDPTHPLSKMAISYFLQQLIRVAHEDFHDHLEPTLRVRAHDVQSVETSLL
ncbi:hypothetical protein E2C01_074035 [Portunus trituberculatus]|uniref:Uncharacterized protein n=1 Tax=Portunus trituberculatus TaxID=210409 RepID=A0A5B7IC73_PORTR|nr:hypothetical protein [Portunus trituberculatus]